MIPIRLSILNRYSECNRRGPKKWAACARFTWLLVLIGTSAANSTASTAGRPSRVAARSNRTEYTNLFQITKKDPWHREAACLIFGTTNQANDRVHIWKAVVELASFSVYLFVLINAAIDGGAVLCRMTHLSQEVP
jgi:hypothetical protein